MPHLEENINLEPTETPENREYTEALKRSKDNLEQQDADKLCAELLTPNSAEATGNYAEAIALELKNLNLRRSEYVKEYGQYLAAQREAKKSPDSAVGLAELKAIRGNYLAQKNNCAEILVAAKKNELEKAGKTEEDMAGELQNYISTEIFKILVVNEEKILQEQQAAEYPPKEKGVLRRAYDYWDNLSPVKKTLITTALATGIAFTSTALKTEANLSLAATALFFSKSFILNLGQDVISGLAGLGINKLLMNKIEKETQAETEKLKTESALRNLNEISQKYHQLLEKKTRRGGAALIASALTAVATGQAYNIGLSWLSNTSALKDAFAATGSILENTQDVMGKIGIAETTGKPTAGFIKRIARSIFKGGPDID